MQWGYIGSVAIAVIAAVLWALLATRRSFSMPQLPRRKPPEARPGEEPSVANGKTTADSSDRDVLRRPNIDTSIDEEVLFSPASPAIEDTGVFEAISDEENEEDAEIEIFDDATSPVIDEETGDYRVWFGTNREPLSGSDLSTGFSGERSSEVRYGFVTVHIPKSHRIGSIGSSLIFRIVHLADDRLKIRRRYRMSPEDFWDAVRQQISAVGPADRHAVVFIHGYNVTFDDAAIRAAQIGKDLGVGGAMAFFSWPSKGRLDGYQADGATIEASERQIAAFLADFAQRSGASAVHVIAHSMGNRGLLRAISRIANDAEKRAHVRFGQFILAAPDVDVDTFLDLAAHYKDFAKRATLYVSSRDRAVGLSKWLHDYPRVGFTPPVSVFPDIDTISVDNVDLTLIGHGYVGEARDVLQDMHGLIFEGAPPERRFGLRRGSNEKGDVYWIVDK